MGVAGVPASVAAIVAMHAGCHQQERSRMAEQDDCPSLCRRPATTTLIDAP
jgi:hypothetical protein